MDDERGALLILTTLLLPALVALGALSIGGTTLWAAHDDVQRSVDLAALAGAAHMPTVDASALAAKFPAGIGGWRVTHAFTDQLDAGDWQARPCAVVARQFTGNRSVMVNAFKATDDARTCTTAWQWESPFLAAASACANDVLDATSCGSRLGAQLGVTLPPLDAADPTISAIDTAAASLAGLYADANDKAMSAATSRLPTGCTATVTVVGTKVCTQTVSQLLSLLGLAPTALPTRVGVNLPGLLPAATTPRVQLSVDGARVRPALSPFTFTVSGTATARRTIKSALVLPSLGIPGISSASAFSQLPTPLQDRLNTLLGGQAAPLLAAAGTQGYVVDPNDITRNTPAAVDATLGVVYQLDGVVSNSLLSSLTTVACNTAPASVWCPQITGPSTAQLRGGFVQDLADATRPPPSGSTPSLNQMLDDYAGGGQPLWVVGALRRTHLGDILGSSAWSVLTDPSVNPALAPLLSELMLIPALDVVPATVGRTVIGGNPYYTLTTVPLSDTLATEGLFQARLVK